MLWPRILRMSASSAPSPRPSPTRGAGARLQKAAPA
jgi:hypothetical protein